MNEMIHRVATAIELAEIQWKAANDGDNASCLDCPDAVKAKAAIEAMREPTEAMQAKPGAGSFFALSSASAKIIWQSMIDAALVSASDPVSPVVRVNRKPGRPKKKA